MVVVAWDPTGQAHIGPRRERHVTYPLKDIL
jgi:hypothetical protein